MREEQAPKQMEMEMEFSSSEEQLQQLRSKSTELFLREQWRESVQVYTQIIALCQDQISTSNNNNLHHQSKLQKSLCLAFSNRAESLSRLRDFEEALWDCDRALEIERAHFKTLLCKGKILMGLNRYSMALDCFRAAQSDPQASGFSESLNGHLEKCKKLEFQSRTGSFDLSDWVANGFRGKCPDLAEYIGPVQIKRSEISGRGLFATKNIDAGTLLIVTKAIATERAILSGDDSGENEQLVMWKNLIDKVTDCASKCPRTASLISTLSSGEDEANLEVPDMGLFRAEEHEGLEVSRKKLDMERNQILSILDVNSLVEDAVSAKVLGKNGGYHGVGLWVMSSFINHSCNPNSRRLHVGEFVMVHASRDVKAGEEITSAYFDVLSPPDKRKELAETWGFCCGCKRCKFEEKVWSKEEMREIEMGLERGMDVGGVVYRLEERMRRLVVRGKEKGTLRASFWGAYCETYGCEKVMKRWGRRIPAAEVVVDSIVEAVGSDERVVKVVLERMKRSGGGLVEMERALSLGRGLYGKAVKKSLMQNSSVFPLTDASINWPSKLYLSREQMEQNVEVV